MKEFFKHNTFIFLCVIGVVANIFYFEQYLHLNVIPPLRSQLNQMEPIESHRGSQLNRDFDEVRPKNHAITAIFILSVFFLHYTPLLYKRKLSMAAQATLGIIFVSVYLGLVWYYSIDPLLERIELMRGVLS